MFGNVRQCPAVSLRSGFRPPYLENDARWKFRFNGQPRGSRWSSIECRSQIPRVTSSSGRNCFRSNFQPPYLGNGKRWTIGLNGERIGNRHRPFERSPQISCVTSYKGRMGIRSFYEIGQSLVMGRSSGRGMSVTTRDGRFVSTENLWEVDGLLSNAAVGSDV